MSKPPPRVPGTRRIVYRVARDYARHVGLGHLLAAERGRKAFRIMRIRKELERPAQAGRGAEVWFHLDIMSEPRSMLIDHGATVHRIEWDRRKAGRHR